MVDMNSREKLILSAQQLIWERGVVGISLKDVREHAGVGHGSMYHHFKCKNELALEAINRSSDEVLQGVRKIVESDLPAYDKIEAILSRKTNIQKGCKVGSLVNDATVMNVGELRDCVKGMFARFAQLLKQVFEEGIAQKEFSKTLDPERSAWGVIALLEGGFVSAKALGNNHAFKAAVHAYLDLLKSATPK